MLHAELPLPARTLAGFVGYQDTATDLHRQPRAQLEMLLKRQRCAIAAVSG